MEVVLIVAKLLAPCSRRLAVTPAEMLCRFRTDPVEYSFESAFGSGRLLVEELCELAETPIEWIECSEVMELLLLLSPPVCSSGVSVKYNNNNLRFYTLRINCTLEPLEAFLNSPPIFTFIIFNIKKMCLIA